MKQFNTGQTVKLTYYVYTLTNYVQISELSFSRDCVDLTHVPSLVLFVDIVNVKIPRPVLVVFVVSHADTWISSYHMIMYS